MSYFSMAYPRRHRRQAEAPRRARGIRFQCSRCDEWWRMPTNALYDLPVPALCGGCIQDDLSDAIRHRPRVQLYRQASLSEREIQ